MAFPASAEVFGYYQTQAECEAAKAAGSGVNSHGEPLHCDWSPGDDGKGVWLLGDNRGGG